MHLIPILVGATVALPAAAVQIPLDPAAGDPPTGSVAGTVTLPHAYPDADLDGRPELAMLIRDFALKWAIRVIDPDDGSVLRTLPIGLDTVYELDVIDDLDGDGWDDFAIGDAQSVSAWSYRTGRRLWIRPAIQAGDGTGTTVLAIPDVNGDGVADVVTGAPFYIEGFFGAPTGAVHTLSGADGSPLDTQIWFDLDSIPSQIGVGLDLLGDPDGDGKIEIVVGCNSPDAAIVTPLVIQDQIEIVIPPGGVQSTARVAGFGGVGPSHFYFAVADPTWGFGQEGRVTIYSAIDGLVAGDLFHPGSGQPVVEPELFFGAEVLDAGDLDQDGVEDLLVRMQPSAQSGGDVDPQWACYSGNFGFGLIGLDPASDTTPAASFAKAGNLDDDPAAELWVVSPTVGQVDAGEQRVRELQPAGTIVPFGGEFDAADGVGFGLAANLVGDLDGDGRAELAVGAPHRASPAGLSAGRISVYRSGGTLWFEVDGAPYEEFGSAVTGIDDVNGDGVPDLLVGRPWAQWGQSRRGAVSLLSGLDGSLLRAHGGTQTASRFGAAVARVPDADGDGVDDYAVGAPDHDLGVIAEGRVQLFSGASGAVLRTFDGPLLNARFGQSVAGIEDIDGDGRGDLLVGAPGAWNSIAAFGAGEVWRYSGRTGAFLGKVTGDQSGEDFGATVVALGDLDGDGVPDWAASAPRHNGLGIDDGEVELRSGTDGALIRRHTGAFGEGLGTGLAAIGDTDGDGVDDYAYGSPAALLLASFETVGRVQVVSGRDGAPIRSLDSAPLQGGQPTSGFGRVLGAGGDRDGDGLGDLVLGLPTSADAGTPIDDAAFAAAGAVEPWSLRAVGTAIYGGGTPGCAGALRTIALDRAEPGSAIDLRLFAVEPGGLPLLAVALTPDAAGTPLPQGMLLHVDLGSIFLLESGLPTAEAFADRAVPTPDDAGLVGFTLYFQELVLWPVGCDGLGASWSSSSGLEVTFQ